MDVSYLYNSFHLYLTNSEDMSDVEKSVVRHGAFHAACDDMRCKHVLIVFAAQVMDYADGGDLHQRIQRTRQAGKVFSEDRIVRRPQGDVSSLLQLCLNRQVMIWDVQIWSIWKQSRPILFFFRVVVFVGECWRSQITFQQNLGSSWCLQNKWAILI